MKMKYTLHLFHYISYIFVLIAILLPLNSAHAIRISPPIIEGYFAGEEEYFQFPLSIINDEVVPIEVNFELFRSNNRVPMEKMAEIESTLNGDFIKAGERKDVGIYLPSILSNDDYVLVVSIRSEAVFGPSTVVNRLIIPIDGIFSEEGMVIASIDNIQVEEMDNEVRGSFELVNNIDQRLRGFYIVDLILDDESVISYNKAVDLVAKGVVLEEFSFDKNFAFNRAEQRRLRIRYFSIAGARAIVEDVTLESGGRGFNFMPLVLLSLFGIMTLYFGIKYKKSS